MDEIKIAVLPEEIVLGTDAVGPCEGDGCNSDQGGCTGDAGCGQHC